MGGRHKKIADVHIETNTLWLERDYARQERDKARHKLDDFLVELKAMKAIADERKQERDEARLGRR